MIRIILSENILAETTEDGGYLGEMHFYIDESDLETFIKTAKINKLHLAIISFDE
jgi:hypothetical protein